MNSTFVFARASKRIREGIADEIARIEKQKGDVSEDMISSDPMNERGGRNVSPF